MPVRRPVSPSKSGEPKRAPFLRSPGVQRAEGSPNPDGRSMREAALRGRALAPSEDVEAVERYNQVWGLWRKGMSSGDVAAELGLPLAVVEEFEVVGLPSQGLPALLDRERLRVRSVLDGGDTETERLASQAKSADEVARVRINAVKTQADRVVKAIDDGLKSKEEEAKLVRANRIVALSMSRVNANLLEGALALSERVGRALAAQDDPTVGPEDKLTLLEAVKALKQIGEIAKITAETSRVAVQLERLVLGEPTSIVGHVAGESADAELRDMDPEAAGKWISAASEAFAKHQRRERQRATAIDVETVKTSDGGKLALKDAHH